jgi:hypothetical protein
VPPRIFLPLRPLALAFALAACAGGEDAALELGAMPPDTYDNCSTGIGGVSIFSSGGGGVVSLGMTECALVKVLGDPAQVTRDPAAGGPRRVTLTYAHPDGTGTAYVFVNNALKEIERAGQSG